MWPAANAHVPSPAWPSQRLQQPASGRKWSGHPGMCIPIARAGHRHVDREDKRLAPLLGRHRQKIAHKGAIPYHIELKPDRTRAAHDLRDVTDRDRRKAEGNISRPCGRSEEHTSELQSLMRISYAVFCLKKKTKHTANNRNTDSK